MVAPAIRRSPTRSCKADVVPTIICPRCRTANRPKGLSALDCTNCRRSIDPRRLDASATTFIRRQRKLRKRSESSPGPLGQDEADELREWILEIPSNHVPFEEDAGLRSPNSRGLIDPLSAAWHRLKAIARRQRPAALYIDSIVELRDDDIVIKRYYWPVGRKRIAYTEIRGFTSRPLRAWHGQFRVQGIDHRGRWYSRDRHRGEKEQAIDLTVGRLINPVLTPDDVDAVLDILERKVIRGSG